MIENPIIQLLFLGCVFLLCALVLGGVMHSAHEAAELERELQSEAQRSALSAQSLEIPADREFIDMGSTDPVAPSAQDARAASASNRF